MIITKINGIIIENSEGFYETVKGLGTSASIVANDEPVICNVEKPGYLGITVRDLSGSRLKFGMDIHGGTRIILKPTENITKDVMEQMITTLNTRINLYGLSEMRINLLGENLIQIEMAGAKGEEVKNFLSKQGKFEAKIAETIETENGTGTIILGDNKYLVRLADGKIKINDSFYSMNESFYLENIKFDIGNITDKGTVVFVNVFSGNDIVTVYTDPQNSPPPRFVGNVYEFAFTVQISKEGAERFAKVTKNQPTVFTGKSRYLVSPLVLFLDNKATSQLNIAADLAGKAITTPSISGSRTTKNEATQEKLRLQTILRSGNLPTEIEIVKVDTISPTVGKELVSSTIYIVIASVLVVSVIVFVRYKRAKIIVPMVLISFSEILIILGFAAFTQTITDGNGWVLDIPAIAGLIAVLGTSISQLIIITDQLFSRKDVVLSIRQKMAINMILTSAYIVIVAMLPLIVMGVGSLRGFAFTTIIGVLIGVLVTRHVYTFVVERIEKL